MLSFSTFFSQSLNIMDQTDITGLCQGLEYDKFKRGDLLYKEGDKYNGRIHVIISGRIGLLKHPPRDRNHCSLFKAKPFNEKFLTTATFSLKNEDNNKTQTNSILVVEPEQKGFNSPKLRTRDKGGYSHISGLGESSMVTNNSYEHLSPSVSNIRETYEGIPKFIHFDDQDEEFVDYASTFGELMRNIEEGEAVGHIKTQVQNSKQRWETALCITDCEVITIVEKNLDLLSLKEQRKKQDFLKEAFPISEYTENLSNHELGSFFSLFKVLDLLCG